MGIVSDFIFIVRLVVLLVLLFTLGSEKLTTYLYIYSLDKTIRFSFFQVLWLVNKEFSLC